MRWMLVVAMGCSNSAAPSGDAEQCACLALGSHLGGYCNTRPLADPMCEPGGLGQIDINGAWAATIHTVVHDSFDGTVTETMTSATVTIVRDGTGACHFGMPTINPLIYVDDNAAGYPHMSVGPHVSGSFVLCKRSSDGALVYRSGMNSSPMGGGRSSSSDAVLTR